MNIPQRLQTLRSAIPGQVKIVAVSKTHPVTDILEAYRCGQRIFGENKAQELVQKHSELPADIEWHFIGHLQTNKVRFIAPFISLIHSIDSLKLLEEVNREAHRNSRVIDCLLQFHIATEESKFGLDMEEAVALLGSPRYRELQNIRVTGVMGMGSFTDDLSLTRREFQMLKGYFTSLRSDFFDGNDDFREISMGMSGDYPIAIEEGSTMVRIGTTIFGNR